METSLAEQAAEVAQICEQDQWPAEVRSCMVKAASIEATMDCMTTLMSEM